MRSEYWVVDPERRQIEMSILSDDTYDEPRIIATGRCESATLRGLVIDVDALFGNLE